MGKERGLLWSLTHMYFARMKNNSRTTNTLYNFTSSIGAQLITILMHFIVRTVFIRTLGKSYLGISGLFSNILSMLSLAELGVGSAIIFKLYKPIAENDKHRITVLVKFYERVYRFIGISIGVIGIALIPFLPVLISDYDKLERLNINAVLIFILYLSKSVVSYMFFAYKSSIIKANQKGYIINIISYFFTIATAAAQIISLIVWPNFTVYVLIMVIQVIVQNMLCARLADRMYPFINDKTDDKLDKKEVIEVFKDCGALFLYKMNAVVLKATDNIVLSMFIGLDIVAEYSNYYILYNTLNSLFNKIFHSVSHSLGNLHASESTGKEYRVFETTMLITAIIGGTAGVGVFVVADELIDTWIGKEWIIAQPFSFFMGMEIFTNAYRIGLSEFRTTMGLFRQNKFRPVLSMVVNVVLSVALVGKIGIIGVLIGTVAADWSTMMWLDPIIIHKYGYKNDYPVIRYFMKVAKNVLVIVCTAVVDFWICTRFFTGWGWFSVGIHSIICGMTIPAALIFASFNEPAGKYVFALADRTIRRAMRTRDN